MQTVVKKWGNSLALRLPQAVASELQLAEGAAVSLSIEGHALVVKPARKRYRLDELLARMPQSAKRPETEWGPATGEEAW